MASTLTNVSTVFPHRETYVYNILTEVPSGASITDSITDLPLGVYRIYFLGYATTSSTNTIQFSLYLNAARTASMTVVTSSCSAGGTEVVSEAAFAINTTGVRGFICGGGDAAATSVSIGVPTVLPYGITWTYTKNSTTDVDFTLVFERIG